MRLCKFIGDSAETSAEPRSSAWPWSKDSEGRGKPATTPTHRVMVHRGPRLGSPSARNRKFLINEAIPGVPPRCCRSLALPTHESPGLSEGVRRRIAGHLCLSVEFLSAVD